MFFTFEFVCLSNFVSYVFCFYSSDCFFFFGFFFKWFIRFLYSPSLLSQQLIYCKALGRNNSEVGQEPITRREQLPCAHATAFSRTSLFLERFLARILNTF